MQNQSSTKSIKVDNFLKNGYSSKYRKFQNPYHSLAKKNKEIQELKNTVKILEEKDKNLLNKYHSKKIRINQIQTSHQEANRRSQGGQEYRKYKNFNQSQNWEQKQSKSNQKSHKSSIIRKRNEEYSKTRKTDILLNESTISIKQKLKNHVRELSLERKISKKRNFLLRKSQQKQSLNQKQILKQSVSRFKQNLIRKKQEMNMEFHKKMMLQKIQELKELQPISLDQKKLQKKLKKQKSQLDMRIRHTQFESQQLTLSFMRNSKIFDQSIANHVIYSNMVSIR